MNRYMTALGIAEAKAQFVDVYGTSDDLLQMVPSPVHAVLLVYPICTATEKRIAEQQAAQRDEVAAFRKAHPFFFTHQRVPNMCGTVAIVHALLNNRDKIGEVCAGSILDSEWAKPSSVTVDPKTLGERVAEDERLANAHGAAAQEGATANGDGGAEIDLHFVCFIHAGGRCVELDGRKENPTLHSYCTDNASFLNAAAAAIQERMELNPQSYEFGITALVNK
ncbi:hypothetical protein LSCM1_05214 [Leishmania martiniquensis]|uniref:Ubiquitin carboxyl-terminal hydrolase n=1 Tax=Leishmania martiniquensis TaxID=1580590 RepID=A0A836GZX3_9TRYP|nr:hypothetical protein LSCM1_05214 [Leishmania martiniquensis]